MRHMRWAKAALALPAVLGLTFGLAVSANAQTTRVRPGTPAMTVASSSRIGIGGRDVTSADVARNKLSGEFGAYVEDVAAGGPAEKAGIRAGDVIIEFDGVRVRSYAELQRLVRETPAGRAVKVGVARDGKRVDLPLTTEANPGARDFTFDFPLPQFRQGPPQPSPRYRGNPEEPFVPTPPQAGRGFVYPGPIPLSPNTARLGISIEDLTPQLAEYFHTKQGVLVASVDDGSAAARAGIKAGDIIASIDGRGVARRDDVSAALRGKRAGEQVTLGIVRDGKTITIKATLTGEARGAVGPA